MDPGYPFHDSSVVLVPGYSGVSHEEVVDTLTCHCDLRRLVAVVTNLSSREKEESRHQCHAMFEGIADGREKTIFSLDRGSPIPPYAASPHYLLEAMTKAASSSASAGAGAVWCISPSQRELVLCGHSVKMWEKARH